jgi:hypothetical protein
MSTLVGTAGSDALSGAGLQVIFGLGGNDVITSDSFLNSELCGGARDGSVDLVFGGSGLADDGAGRCPAQLWRCRSERSRS